MKHRRFQYKYVLSLEFCQNTDVELKACKDVLFILYLLESKNGADDSFPIYMTCYQKRRCSSNNTRFN